MLESDVKKIHDIAYDVQGFIKKHESLKEDLEFEKRRNTLLAEDKASLKKELELELTLRRWQPMSGGQCPKDTRVLVRGKDKYVAFATQTGSNWLSGRTLLDFTPLEWMTVPD